VLWNGNHQVRSNLRRPGCRFTQQRPDHGERRRIEAAEPRARVFESLNPVLRITRITNRGNADPQRRRGSRANQARLVAWCRCPFLAERAASNGDSLESAITFWTQHGVGSDWRAAAGATGGEREIECSAPEHADSAGPTGTAFTRVHRSLHASGPVVRGASLSSALWRPSSAQSLRAIRVRPLISSGCGIFIRSSTVGARSTSPPSRSCRPTASWAIQNIGT
jgi:hypothetical protein